MQIVNKVYNVIKRIENFILPPSKDGHHEGGTWGEVAWFVVSIIVSYFISEIMEEDLPEPPETTEVGQKEKGIKVNTRSTQEKIAVVYGLRRVGGNDVYGYTFGNEDRDLYLVQTLSEGECDSIYQKGGVDQIWFGDKLWNTFGASLGDNVDYWFHNGAPSQTVDTNLSSIDSNWTDALENTCYILFKLRYDRDYFRGIPQRQVELKGKKLYDFRYGTTAWSDNPTLCLYDFITNTRYGVGLPASQIDVSSWTTIANYCDTKNFTLNMVIKQDKSAWDIIQNILDHFRGRIGWWDGKFYLKAADLNEESSVMTIEDKHIFQEESGKSTISISQPGRFSKPDGLKVKFVDKEKQYSVDDLPVGEQAGVINTFELLGCTDREMAANLAVSRLERLQLDRGIAGVFRDDCIMLEPHDVITFNSDDLGISDQLMRVTNASIINNHLINLGLRYESYDLYNDDYDLDVEAEYKCSLPDPNAEPPEVSNASITEETYWYRLTSYTRLKIDFDEPADYAWYDYVEVWMAIADSPVAADYKHQFNTTTSFEIDPVQEEEAEQQQKYWIRLVTVNIWGVKQSFSNATYLSKRIVGKSKTVPNSLAWLAAIVNDGNLNLYSDKLDDPDIEIYEFRTSGKDGVWVDSVFLASIRSPNYSLTGVKPGEFKFFANTKGTNGLYGDYPKDAIVTVYKPKGWSSAYTDIDDYTDGTCSNAEYEIIVEDNWLKCSHTENNLTGTYVSAEYDCGVQAEYYTYIDTEMTVTGQGLDWDTITLSETLTWDQIGVDTRTWYDIFEVTGAPKLDIEVYYSTTPGIDVDDDQTYDGVAKRMELCALVVGARYFVTKITITDPSSAVHLKVKEFTLTLLD